MRIPKFRAWLKNEKRIVEVVSINWEHKNIAYEVEQGLIFLAKGLKFKNFDEIELMQYTGGKDQNDKEIYEGDFILADIGDGLTLYEVKYIDDDERFISAFDIRIVKELDVQKYKDLPFTIANRLIEMGISDLEIHWLVIGNKFENPELLESD